MLLIKILGLVCASGFSFSRLAHNKSITGVRGMTGLPAVFHQKLHLITVLLMDSDGMFNRGSLEAAPGELSTPSLSLLPSSLSLPPSFLLSYSSVTHLVWVDGHAGGEPDHRDAIKARRVGDRRWSQVVIGLGRVTHQDGVDLQRKSTLSSWHWQEEEMAAAPDSVQAFSIFLPSDFGRFEDESEREYLFSFPSTLLYDQY